MLYCGKYCCGITSVSIIAVIFLYFKKFLRKLGRSLERGEKKPHSEGTDEIQNCSYTGLFLPNFEALSDIVHKLFKGGHQKLGREG